ncbi:MAG: ribonuclease HII [Ferroplasma sp.]
MACGIDEAGRGPVIGPMVMAILCGSDKELNEIGVKDSKQLSPASRSRMFMQLESFEHRYFIISPEEIDNYVKNKKLNVLEENYAIRLASHVGNNSRIYVDSFDVNELRLQEKLIAGTGADIICKHKADEIYPQVSGASIIAKVIRDNEIEKLHKIYGDFGSGYPSDPKTVKFLNDSIKNGKDIDSIARHQWKTYKKLFNHAFF